MKIDRDFVPVSAAGPPRVHLSATDAVWELLINGNRFFDTRALRGGGGAVDLVRHVWQVEFKQAMRMQREAGA